MHLEITSRMVPQQRMCFCWCVLIIVKLIIPLWRSCKFISKLFTFGILANCYLLLYRHAITYLCVCVRNSIRSYNLVTPRYLLLIYCIYLYIYLCLNMIIYPYIGPYICTHVRSPVSFIYTVCAIYIFAVCYIHSRGLAQLATAIGWLCPAWNKYYLI